MARRKNPPAHCEKVVEFKGLLFRFGLFYSANKHIWASYLDLLYFHSYRANHHNVLESAWVEYNNLAVSVATFEPI